MDKFEKILDTERAYRRKADKIFADYKKEEAQMRARLSPEAFKNEFLYGRWITIAANFRSETDSTVRKVTEIFGDLKHELREWLMRPVKPEILEIMRYTNDFKLHLSLNELKVIEREIVNAYFGRKIFVSIAKNNGFYADSIDIDELLCTLDTAQSVVESRIRSYAGGEGFPGKDLIDHKIIDGVDWGEYSLPELAMASVEPKSNDLDYVKNLWIKMRAPMTYILTEEEAKSIAKKLDPLVDRWGDVDTKGAEKVREEMPDIISRLDSMPDDYEHKETFRKYFLLNHAGSKNQSESENKKEPESSLVASPSIKQAKEYAERHGTVNMDILNQF